MAVAGTLTPKRGEIYWVCFPDASGSEQSGTRPALIIQNDVGNMYSPTTIVIPITSRIKALHMPTHVLIKSGNSSGLRTDSMILGEEIRTIDKKRIRSKVGEVDSKRIQNGGDICSAIQASILS